MHQYATLEDTVYLWFGVNDTAGSGADGSTPLYDVREGGAAAGAIPTLSGTPTLLTHANYPAGAHEIAIAATAGNGFSANKTYGVFCTLLVDSQNPTGFVGSFRLAGVPVDLLDLANGVETGKTVRQALRLIAAAAAGKRTNSGTATEQYDAIGAPGTARIVGNLDAAGDGTPTLTP